MCQPGHTHCGSPVVKCPCPWRLAQSLYASTAAWHKSCRQENFHADLTITCFQLLSVLARGAVQAWASKRRWSLYANSAAWHGSCRCCALIPRCRCQLATLRQPRRPSGTFGMPSSLMLQLVGCVPPCLHHFAAHGFTVSQEQEQLESPCCLVHLWRKAL